MRGLIPILIAAAAVLIIPRSAHAYLDPGSASYAIQILIGALVGVLVAVKAFWRQIKFFFQGLFSKEKREDEKGGKPR